MSIEEKLAARTAELERQRAEEERQAADAELTPIRQRIDELENMRAELLLLKGSLELRSDNTKAVGKGMEEFAADTKQESESEKVKLQALIDRNIAALQAYGVESLEDLVNHPDFSEEPEVIAYKKALEQNQDLTIGNSELKSKLAELNILVDEGFSYRDAVEGIRKKLESLDHALNQEKIKTPEGRAEVVESLVEKLEREITQIGFIAKKKNQGSQYESLEGYQLMIGNQQEWGYQPREEYSNRISFEGGKAKISSWQDKMIVPRAAEGLKEEYGDDIVSEAVLKAYERKIDEAIRTYDSKNENVLTMLDDIKRVDEKAKEAANIEFSAYNRQLQALSTALFEKERELKAAGIEFDRDAEIKDRFRDRYSREKETLKKLALLAEGQNYSDDFIKEALDMYPPFPPKIDYVKLKAVIEKRREEVESFIEAVRSIQTEEDLRVFMNLDRRDSGVAKVRQGRLSRSDFEEKTRFEFTHTEEGTPEEVRANQQSEKKFASFANGGRGLYYAKKDLQERAEKLEKMKKAGVSTIQTAIEAKSVGDKLKKEMEENGIYQGYGYNYDVTVQEASRKIATDTIEARRLLTELTRLEAILGKEEDLELHGGEITVKRFEAMHRNLIKQIEGEEIALANLGRGIAKHQQGEPRFMKGKWQKELDAMKQEEIDLRTRIENLRRNDLPQALRSKNARISIEQKSSLNDVIQRKHARGNSQTIFSDLRIELTGILNKSLPDSLIRLSSEYAYRKNLLQTGISI